MANETRAARAVTNGHLDIALAHPATITVGIRKTLEELEDSDEEADLAAVERRLEKIEQKMLSFAEQRAEGVILLLPNTTAD